VFYEKAEATLEGHTWTTSESEVTAQGAVGEAKAASAGCGYTWP
jgi:hypothetical protein